MFPNLPERLRNPSVHTAEMRSIRVVFGNSQLKDAMLHSCSKHGLLAAAGLLCLSE